MAFNQADYISSLSGVGKNLEEANLLRRQSQATPINTQSQSLLALAQAANIPQQLEINQKEYNLKLANAANFARGYGLDPKQLGLPDAIGGQNPQNATPSLSGATPSDEAMVNAANNVKYPNKEDLREASLSGPVPVKTPGGEDLTPAVAKRNMAQASLSGAPMEEEMPLSGSAKIVNDYFKNIADVKSRIPFIASSRGPAEASAVLAQAQQGTPIQQLYLQQDANNIKENDVRYNAATGLAQLTKEYTDILNTMPKKDFDYLKRLATDQKWSGKFNALNAISKKMIGFGNVLVHMSGGHPTDYQTHNLAQAFGSPQQPWEGVKLNLKVINDIIARNAIDSLKLRDYYDKTKTTQNYSHYLDDIKSVKPEHLKQVAPLLLKRKDLE